jgi:ATP adenylyltransferase
MEDSYMTGSCRFCEVVLAAANGFGCQPCDTIMFQTENFVAIPSLGSIVPGWILLVSKTHYICVGELGSELIEELESLKATVKSELEDRFGEVVVFEHGPVSPGQPAGCGVDHLHVHLVPTRADMLRGVSELYNEAVSWKVVDGLSAVRSCFLDGTPYLFVEQYDVSHVWSDDSIASQTFRRVIASFHEVPEAYNWHQHEWLDNVNATLIEMQMTTAR